MDGRQGKLAGSLQSRLSFGLAAIIAAWAILAGLMSFHAAMNDANGLQDDQLRKVAALVDRQAVVLPSADMVGDAEDSDAEARVVVQELGDRADGQGQDGPLALPEGLPDGVQTVTVADARWRFYVQTLKSGRRLAIGQQAGFREAVARDAALRAVMPMIGLIPVLIGLVAVVIRLTFTPVGRLGGAIDRRDDWDLGQVDGTRVPDEVRPFVAAINRLLHRVSRSIDAQRRFVADAAHELRTPLTALLLQAERLDSAEMPPVAKDRVAALRRGLQRTGSLVEQLLGLARAHQQPAQPPEPVALFPILRGILEELLPLADAKHIALALTASEGVAPRAAIAVLDFATVARNLIDNAIRYTPAGGRVDLALLREDAEIVLSIEDNGPGIAATERHRVFEPFYRLDSTDGIGSGLGLSIVAAICQRTRTDISLTTANLAGSQSGLRATFRLAAV